MTWYSPIAGPQRDRCVNNQFPKIVSTLGTRKLRQKIVYHDVEGAFTQVLWTNDLNAVSAFASNSRLGLSFGTHQSIGQDG
jgi:hypothetical protein